MGHLSASAKITLRVKKKNLLNFPQVEQNVYKL